MPTRGRSGGPRDSRGHHRTARAAKDQPGQAPDEVPPRAPAGRQARPDASVPRDEHLGAVGARLRGPPIADHAHSTWSPRPETSMIRGRCRGGPRGAESGRSLRAPADGRAAAGGPRGSRGRPHRGARDRPCSSGERRRRARPAPGGAMSEGEARWGGPLRRAAPPGPLTGGAGRGGPPPRVGGGGVPDRGRPPPAPSDATLGPGGPADAALSWGGARGAAAAARGGAARAPLGGARGGLGPAGTARGGGGGGGALAQRQRTLTAQGRGPTDRATAGRVDDVLDLGDVLPCHGDDGPLLDLRRRITDSWALLTCGGARTPRGRDDPARSRACGGAAGTHHPIRWPRPPRHDAPPECDPTLAAVGPTALTRGFAATLPSGWRVRLSAWAAVPVPAGPVLGAALAHFGAPAPDRPGGVPGPGGGDPCPSRSGGWGAAPGGAPVSSPAPAARRPGRRVPGVAGGGGRRLGGGVGGGGGGPGGGCDRGPWRCLPAGGQIRWPRAVRSHRDQVERPGLPGCVHMMVECADPAGDDRPLARSGGRLDGSSPGLAARRRPTGWWTARPSPG